MQTIAAVLQAALNRTIVGWKPPVHTPTTGATSALNRTIVGWKHNSLHFDLRLGTDFKSHHSGMETVLNGSHSGVGSHL